MPYSGAGSGLNPAFAEQLYVRVATWFSQVVAQTPEGDSAGFPHLYWVRSRRNSATTQPQTPLMKRVHLAKTCTNDCQLFGGETMPWLPWLSSRLTMTSSQTVTTGTVML